MSMVPRVLYSGYQKLQKKLILFCLLLSSFGYSQKYQEMIDAGTYKLDDIKAEAYEYFKERGFEKDRQYKFWLRWLFEHEQYVDENGYLKSNFEVATKARLFRERINKQKRSQRAPASQNGSWIEVGPRFVNTDREEEYWIGHGRIRGISVDVNNPNHIIIGGYSVGIWKTIDGGDHWEVLTDNFSASLTVRSCEISPFNSNVYIYGSEGAIFKSEDGGDTWSLVANAPDNVNDIQFKKGDPNTIFAAGQTIARSTDGGNNWTVINGFDLGTKMIGLSEANPSIVYVIEEKNDRFNGLYKSVNGGASFTKLDHTGKDYFGRTGPTAISTGEKTQAPFHMAICVSQTNPNNVY